MAKFIIIGNALDFNSLLACIAASSGSPGQLKVKNDVLERTLKAWPELNKDDESAERLDDQSPEAYKTREMELDTEEQGALAETFLAAVKAPGTTGAKFRLYRRAATLIQVSKWWERQTTEKLAAFRHGDNPQVYSDVNAEGTPSTPIT